MGRLFPMDNPIMRFLGFVGDLILLNFLFIVCCLPIISIGASASALYTVTLQFIRKEGGSAGKEFLRAFAGNFRKTVPMTLLFLAVGAVLALCLWSMLLTGGKFGLIIWSAWAIACLLFLMELSYAFAVQARFENTVLSTMKNAAILALAHPGKTMCIIICSFLPVSLLLFETRLFVLTGFIWMLFGFSGLALVNSILFHKIFEPYTKK